MRYGCPFTGRWTRRLPGERAGPARSSPDQRYTATWLPGGLTDRVTFCDVPESIAPQPAVVTAQNTMAMRLRVRARGVTVTAQSPLGKIAMQSASGCPGRRNKGPQPAPRRRTFE